MARSARAQGETDRDFALPGGSADELQPGDIRAGDEQHEQRSADHEEQTFAIIAHHLVAQRTQREIPAFVKFRIALRETAAIVASSACTVETGTPGFSRPITAQKRAVGHGVFAAFVRENPPERRDAERILESARHDADDFVRNVVERDRFADDLARGRRIVSAKDRSSSTTLGLAPAAASSRVKVRPISAFSPSTLK